MLVSAEARWFWPGAAPAGLEKWFTEARGPCCASGGPMSHTHEYLRDPGQVELGIKRRDAKPGVEIKALVAVVPQALAAGPFSAPIEIWTKHASTPIELPPGSTIVTAKRRSLRKFETSGPRPREIPLGPDELPLGTEPLPAVACNVEFTWITLPGGEMWCTFGFEAFGPLHTVEASLRAAAAELVARQPPTLAGGMVASYPAWLAGRAGRRG